MPKKPIKVVRESDTGRNEIFQVGNGFMNRERLVSSIKNGNHDDYHIRKINNVETPVSNPDKNKRNNLG